MSAPELWGGAECTIARVGDAYIDQVALTGHEAARGDFELFAELGLKRLRFPVVWERVAPEGLAKADWRWCDEGLARLRELGVKPIVGLLHHGSGPRHTSLDDPDMPEKFAEYAAAVAQRYPWVDMWTPINEPLTTARFCGLYGFWHPHVRVAAAFLRMLLNQTEGIGRAMAEIRRVNPAAMLVHTEDLGEAHGTPATARQVAFENERRWLSIDLLLGRVGLRHAMWGYFERNGLGERVLEVCERPCPPDILGFNHYLSSERYLDDEMALYPSHTRGGNGELNYADVEASRALPGGARGPEALLRTAWERYRLPLAVTEVHNGSSRDENLRWLLEVWSAACRLRREGVDVRAVTSWALLGSYDWSSMLVRCAGAYEPGAFDIRGCKRPRPTAIARALRQLARSGTAEHPVLDTLGWWRRPDRFLWRQPAAVSAAQAGSAGRQILIVGANGTLGRAFSRICETRGLQHRLVGRVDCDIADAAHVASAIEKFHPWAVINAAGYVRVDDAEADCERCWRENAHGPAVLAAACAAAGVRLATFSSDLVFDGRKGAPYDEGDATAPLCVYGDTKAEAERATLAALPEGLVIRTSAFFGPWDRHNFLHHALGALSRGEPFRAADDFIVSPTFVPDLVHATLDLLIDGESGVWHLANRGSISWADLARLAADRAGLDHALVEPTPGSALGWRAVRPRNSALESRRGALMPELDRAVADYVAGWSPEVAV